jgi:hypothetical protein
MGGWLIGGDSVPALLGVLGKWAPGARWGWSENGRLENGKSLLGSNTLGAPERCMPLPIPLPSPISLPGNGGWVGKYLRGSYRCRRRYRYRCRCLKSPIGGGRGWKKGEAEAEPEPKPCCHRCRYLVYLSDRRVNPEILKKKISPATATYPTGVKGGRKREILVLGKPMDAHETNNQARCYCRAHTSLILFLFQT